MWILSFLPDYVTHLIFLVGVIGVIAGFVLGFVPFIKLYQIPIQIISIIVFSLALYLEGGLAESVIWKAKTSALELKVAKAEAISQEQNTVIVEKIVVQTKKIQDKKDTIIQYIDREVVKNQDVIKYVEMCPTIPDPIIKAINDAAKMRSEVTK